MVNYRKDSNVNELLFIVIKLYEFVVIVFKVKPSRLKSILYPEPDSAVVVLANNSDKSNEKDVELSLPLSSTSQCY